MKLIKDVLHVQLKDDDTSNGGTAFVGETVADFVADPDIILNEQDSVYELNKVLIESGIKPIKE